MASLSSESSLRSDNRSESNDDVPNTGFSPRAASLLHTAELFLVPGVNDAPAQQQTSGGLNAVLNTTNPTVAVLKATAMQQAIGHPINFARILMQLGYEPIAPTRGRTLFGKEALFYPNVFRYLKYIYKIDGFTGLYRGFGCSLASKVVCWYTATTVDQITEAGSTTTNQESGVEWNNCIKKTLREVRCQSWGILLSHPFQVMALRCMGQFIGRESAYSSINIFQNFQEIYDKQGIGGFFVGLIPRWLLEIATIIISNALIHIFKSQFPPQKEIVPLYEYIAAFSAQSATYPLGVVSTVIAVNQSGIRAGMLPVSPIYSHWQDAYKQLGKAEQLKRGANFFNRIAVGTIAPSKPAAPARKA